MQSGEQVHARSVIGISMEGGGNQWAGVDAFCLPGAINAVAALADDPQWTRSVVDLLAAVDAATG
jgi:hypothetical protein